MIYLLDASACITAMRSPGPGRRRIAAAVADGCAISIITLGELLVGAGAGRWPQQARSSLDEFLEPFTIVAFEAECVEALVDTKLYLRRLGQPIGDSDLLIAATALTYELTLVTSDRDFLRIPGLTVEDWTR